MKKFAVLLFALLIVIPAYALCTVDSGEKVCSIPQFREQVSPIFRDRSNGTNMSNPQVQLQPLNRESSMEQMRGPNNNLNYNSGCQFGICLQDPNKSRLPMDSELGN